MEIHYSPAELARMIPATVKTLANWRCDPRRPGPKYRRIGNRILYPKTEVEAWMAEHLHTSTADYPDRPGPAGGLTSLSNSELESEIGELVRRLADLHGERARREVMAANGSRKSGTKAPPRARTQRPPSRSKTPRRPKR